MLRPPIVLLLSLAVTSLLVDTAQAVIRNIPLRADLTNAAEPPLGTVIPTAASGGPRPASFGTAIMHLTINDQNTADPADDVPIQMTFNSVVNNIDFTGTQTPNEPNDNLTIAHIHASPTVTPSTNGGVVWGFFGSPFNDNNPNNNVVTPFATGVGGTITGRWDPPEGNSTTLAAQLTHLRNVRAYVNFHTTQFGGGEVRGMIMAVPEPATMLLLVAGLAAVVAGRRASR